MQCACPVENVRRKFLRPHLLSHKPVRPSTFFLRLSSSDRPKFLAFSKQQKSNDVVKPFFTWKNSFNLKNEHSNSIEKNRNKDRNIFLQYIVGSVNPNMWMLTFNVILGYQSFIFWDFLWFFLKVFFQSDRPTQYQETHSTLHEKKKRGMALSKFCGTWPGPSCSKGG